MIGVATTIEVSAQGSDSRFVVTNLKGAPRWLYEEVYCARGQVENLIKAHKLHLASDRTSCAKATANQFRLLIHTAAYWLLHTLRGLASTIGANALAGRADELEQLLKSGHAAGDPGQRPAPLGRRPRLRLRRALQPCP